jgi:hypothetical protein
LLIACGVVCGAVCDGRVVVFSRPSCTAACPSHAVQSPHSLGALCACGGGLGFVVLRVVLDSPRPLQLHQILPAVLTFVLTKTLGEPASAAMPSHHFLLRQRAVSLLSQLCVQVIIRLLMSFQRFGVVLFSASTSSTPRCLNASSTLSRKR